MGASQGKVCAVPKGTPSDMKQHKQYAEDIVNSILSSTESRGTECKGASSGMPLSFDLNAVEMPHDIMELEKDGTDELRPLKAVATDIVVNEFLGTKDTLYNFLSFVYGLFYYTLYLYRERQGLTRDQLVFVYKGGNILRIISNEFLLELPDQATQALAEFYAPFFKRSDLDFSIYLSPHVSNYDEKFHEVTLIAYQLQDYARCFFEKHMMHYFNLFRYNAEYQGMVLEPYLAAFNEARPKNTPEFVNFKVGEATAIIGNNSSFAYEANPDMTLAFLNEGQEDWQAPVRQVARAEISPPQPGSIMTITHNDALEFGRADLHIRFNLTRTKIIFTLLTASGETQNVGGELIDVSVPHKSDANLEHFFEHLQDNLAWFQLKLKDEVVASFYSYSLSYLISDLYYILFITVDLPWEDSKYAKRLNRLFYLNFVDIFIQMEDARAKLEVLEDLRTLVILPLTQPFNSKRIKASLQKFESKHGGKKLEIHTLVRHILGLVDKVSKQPKEQEALQDFGKVLLENVNFTISTIQNVKQYCSTSGKAREGQLYEGAMQSLV
jgi:hypothetical protein